VVPNDSLAMADTLITMLTNPSDFSPRDFVKQNGDVHRMAQSYADLRHSAPL